MNFQCVLDLLSDFLGHPLIVVLIGGLVAAIVGQRLTVSWQSKRSALEQKHQLIEDITEQLAKLFSAANLAETQRDSLDPGKVRGGLVDPIQNWTIFSEVFGANLRAYFPNTSLTDDMNVIHEAAYTFAHLSGTFDEDARKEHVARLFDILDLKENRFSIDFDLLISRSSVKPDGDLEVPFARSWRMTKLVIEERRDQLSHMILTERSLIETVKPSIFAG